MALVPMDYLRVSQLVLAHWQQVNTALGATPLTLKGGYTIANLQTDRNALQAAITALQPLENTLETAQLDRDTRKKAIQARVTPFRNAVRFFALGTPYENALPTSPSFTAIETKFVKALDDTAALWATLNALPATGAGSIAGFTPPLVLPGGYTLATFTTELAALRTAYINVTNARKNLDIGRQKRDVLLTPLKARLLQYRRAVLALFASTDPLYRSLPVVSPGSKGSTPDAVSASAKWDAATSKAVLTILPSSDPNLDHYSVRTAPPPTYRVKNETTLGRIEKEGTVFATTAGLSAAGATALYKVYVVLKSGREKGSATLKVTRP